MARGRTDKMDLFRMRMESGKDLYAFLSFGVGFFSDVDIESEKARWMGEPR